MIKLVLTLVDLLNFGTELCTLFLDQVCKLLVELDHGFVDDVFGGSRINLAVNLLSDQIETSDKLVLREHSGHLLLLSIYLLV